MKFRIIALGKDFTESGRRSVLCQQVTHDELGFDTLGRQFHWEIDKSSYTEAVEEKLDAIRVAKTVLERAFGLIEVTRVNPNTGEIVKKLIVEGI